MQVLESKTPFERFLEVIHNKRTRQEYTSCLRLFMEHYQITEYEELLKISTEQVGDMIIQYILLMKKKGLSEGLITQRIAALRKFFIVNQMNLNWDYINLHKGEFQKKNRLEAYTKEQIQKLLEICDHRTRAITLIFSSTGIRVGGLPDLKIKHLKRIGDLYQFIIYEGFDEEYITFCTPECATAIDDYLAYRHRAGEVITEDSYLIIKEFDPNMTLHKSEPVLDSTIRNVMSKRMLKAGLRNLIHDVDTTHRKKIPINHGFRMYFCSQLVKSRLQPELRWLLEGHALKQNDDSYIRVVEELHGEYLKAINNLTIDPANRLKEQVQELTEKQDDLTLLKLEHRQEMKKRDEQLQAILSIITVADQNTKNTMAKSLIESGLFK